MTQVWGNACWHLFHVIAVNLQDNQEKLIPEILDIICLICNNLPCPSCTKHANDTLKHLRKNKIKTKENLITFLWQFHNIVNQHSGKDIFTRENHDIVYKNNNLTNIVKTWVKIMNNAWMGSHHHHMMYTMSRQNVVRRVAVFYNNNINAFTQY